MKNRERLMNMALIDLLYEINKYDMDACVVRILDRKATPERCEKHKTCYDCISAWLNEEAKQ